MTTVSQAGTTAETVRNMLSPARPGIAYVMKRYLVQDLAAGDANAFAFAVQNPEGVDCVVTNVVVIITTAGATAGAVLDVDVAGSATGTGDSIIDGLDLNSTGTFDRHKNPGANGGAPVLWAKSGGTNDHLTGKVLVQNAGSLAGKVMIEYTPLE